MMTCSRLLTESRREWGKGGSGKPGFRAPRHVRARYTHLDRGPNMALKGEQSPPSSGIDVTTDEAAPN